MEVEELEDEGRAKAVLEVSIGMFSLSLLSSLCCEEEEEAAAMREMRISMSVAALGWSELPQSSIKTLAGPSVGSDISLSASLHSHSTSPEEGKNLVHQNSPIIYIQQLFLRQ